MKKMDIETAKELKVSSLWEAACQEIEVILNSEMEQMKTCALEDLKYHQYRIKAFEEVLNLPDAVISREE